LEAQELIAFENSIAAEYERGEIPFPIHLSSGNEQQLIDIFKEIRPTDWCFGGWRQHLHALLHGVPPDKLRKAIHDGHSIALNFPEHRFHCSAIVGGILPIAVGVALAIKRRGGSEKVWVFQGDMTAHTGISHECRRYSQNFHLPIKFIVEDNDLSVKTNTGLSWGMQLPPTWGGQVYYDYQSRWPHSGIGKRIDF
jgi:TPP-dependent pyruvate/acetoin dehydrogenase alpha subunit